MFKNAVFGLEVVLLDKNLLSLRKGFSLAKNPAALISNKAISLSCTKKFVLQGILNAKDVNCDFAAQAETSNRWFLW